MRVALVSTYPPQRCGIAAYTRSLAQALADNAAVEPIVLAERGAAAGRDGGIRVRPAFARHDMSWPEDIAAAAAAEGVDVVHVQCATDIFGVDERLPRLCRALRRAAMTSVVTLHTVLPRPAALAILCWNVGRFYRELAGSAQLVLHQATGQVDVLARYGVPPAAMTVIPHGTPEPPAMDRASARRRLGMAEDAPLLAVAGFLHPLKNVHLAIAAVARLRARHPSMRLVIAGAPREGAAVDRAYVRWLRRSIARRALDEHVIMQEEFLSDDALATLIAGADLLLLPYRQPYGSASGMVHLALAAGTPMLCSRSPKFAEVGEVEGADALLPARDPRVWAARIDAWLTDPAARAAARTRLLRCADATRWATIAGRTAALYRALRAQPSLDELRDHPGSCRARLPAGSR